MAKRAAAVLMITTVLITSTYAYAQSAVSPPALETANTGNENRFVGLMGGFYGGMYPVGSVHASDNFVKREKGSLFGAVLGIGYELSPTVILHGGFTLWDGTVSITRHVLQKDMKTQYSMSTGALHAGLLFAYQWFFADVMLYTELPLERDTERVELDGVYVQTNDLKRQYEYGAFAGVGVRVPVLEWLDMLIGVYGGGSFVPSMITTKDDELYALHGAVRIGVIVYFPNQEKQL